MKVFIVVCLAAVAAATSSNVLEAYKRAAGLEIMPQEEEKKCDSTILAGLPAEFIQPPRKLREEEIGWLMQPVGETDLMGLKDDLMKVGKDMMDIANGFMRKFENADFTDFGMLRDALEQFFFEDIMPKELDMEGVKDLVDGLLVRAVMSGTDIHMLGDKNERGCLNMKDDQKSPKELACLLSKFELLEKAIEMRQMMAFHQLYSSEQQMEWCDSVYRLMENPANVTANDLVAAMIDMGKCMFRNGAMIEERLNPDMEGPGMQMVPNLPIPRLIHLTVKMEIYEYMGQMGYGAFMIAEGFIHHNAPRNGSDDMPPMPRNGTDDMPPMPEDMPEDMPAADMEKMEEARDVVEELKEKADAMKEGMSTGDMKKKCKKMKAMGMKMAKQMMSKNE